MPDETTSGGLGKSRSGPLNGVVVLDITRVVAGPFCSMLMADLGATVIKVEHPEEPDYARSFPPFISDNDERCSAFFAQFNRNKLWHDGQAEISRSSSIERQMIVYLQNLEGHSQNRRSTMVFNVIFRLAGLP